MITINILMFQINCAIIWLDLVFLKYAQLRVKSQVVFVPCLRVLGVDFHLIG